MKPLIVLPNEVNELATKVSANKQEEVQTVLQQIFTGTADWEKQVDSIEVKDINDKMSIELAETARKNALTNALRNDTKYSKILVAMRTAKSKAINMEADDAILKATLSTFQSLKDLNMILLTDFYKQIK